MVLDPLRERKMLFHAPIGSRETTRFALPFFIVFDVSKN